MLKAKIREVDTLLEQMRARANNKKSESYPVVLSYPLEIREEGKRNRTDNKAVKSRKRTERRKIKEKKRFLNNIKSRNQHIKNLSNSQLTDEQIANFSQFTFEGNMSNFKTRLQNRDYPARIVEKHLSEIKFFDREMSLAQKKQSRT